MKGPASAITAILLLVIPPAGGILPDAPPTDELTPGVPMVDPTQALDHALQAWSDAISGPPSSQIRHELGYEALMSSPPETRLALATMLEALAAVTADQLRAWQSLHSTHQVALAAFARSSQDPSSLTFEQATLVQQAALAYDQGLHLRGASVLRDAALAAIPGLRSMPSHDSGAWSHATTAQDVWDTAWLDVANHGADASAATHGTTLVPSGGVLDDLQTLSQSLRVGETTIASHDALERILQALPTLRAWSAMLHSNPLLSMMGQPDHVTRTSLDLASSVAQHPGSALPIVGALLGAPTAPVSVPDASAGLAAAMRGIYEYLNLAEPPGLDAAAASLDAPIREAATIMLLAQLDAAHALDALHATSTNHADPSRRNVLDDGPLAGHAWQQRLHALSVYHAAAANLAASMSAAQTILAEHAEQSKPKGSFWDFDWLIPSAAAQAADCRPIPEFSDCVNDILFQDPIAGTLVIAGAGASHHRPPPKVQTPFNPTPDLPNFPSTLPEYHLVLRGPVLLIDLGGDDRYETNAAGVIATYSRDAARASLRANHFVDPFPTALHLDMGGNDRYLPPAGRVHDVIQGAASGGIGLLWDVDGHDTYEGGEHSQGSGGSQVDRRQAMSCRPAPVEQDGANCHHGRHGIGFLLDSAGDDVYRAGDWSQGAAFHGAEAELQPLIPGGAGILVDVAGNDRFEGQGNGQGAAHGGAGVLIDLAGDDDHQRAGTSQREGASIGVFVDAGGDDQYASHSRSEAATCTISGPSPLAAIPPSVGNLSVNLAVEIVADLEGGCTVDASDVLTDDFPPTTPEGIQEWIEQDDDTDSWPNAIERRLGNDDSDGNDYPVGLPAKPPGWPDGSPYPPAAAPIPHQGPTVVNIAGVLEIGQATDGIHEGIPPPLRIELGGNDLYTVEAPTAALHLDVAGNDAYSGSTSCTMGCNGIWLDASGDDSYASSHGLATSALGFGALLDLDGNDVYQAPTIADVLGDGVGMLIDAAGDDTYQEWRTIAPLPARGASVFADLSGDDVYRPVDASDRSSDRNDRILARQSISPDGQLGRAASIFIDRGAGPVPEGPSLPSLGIVIGTDGDDVHVADAALLIDGGGDDTYHNNAGGSLYRDAEARFLSSNDARISIPASRLLPVAAVAMDLAGDDQYTVNPEPALSNFGNIGDFPGRTDWYALHAAQGAGVIGAGLLLDQAGNDRYQAGGRSQGFALAGSGILLDRGGQDHYQAHPAPIQSLSTDGGLTAWIGRLDGRPTILASHPDASCPATPAGVALARDALVAHGAVWFSAQTAPDAPWRIMRWQPAFTAPCEPGASIDPKPALMVDASAPHAHQVEAFARSPGVGWSDDRTGTWKLRGAAFAGSSSTALLDPSTTGNQRDGVMDGLRIVWVDDRDGHAQVYAGSHGSAGSPVAPAAATQLEPTASIGRIAWTETIDDSQIRVAGPNGIQTIGDPNRREGHPTLSGSTLTYATNLDDSPTIIMDRGGTTVALPGRYATYDSDGQHIAVAGLDTSQPGAAIEEVTRIHIGSLATASLSSHGADRDHDGLQGSAWYAGTGILLDEGGNDHYAAIGGAQGATAGILPTEQDFSPHPSDANQGPHALLIDLDGRDVYEARSDAQGAFRGRAIHAPPNVQIGYGIASIIDARGDDTYLLTERGQGYAGTAIGATAIRSNPTPGPDPSIVTDTRSAWLLDLGGRDVYQSETPPTTLLRVDEVVGILCDPSDCETREPLPHCPDGTPPAPVTWPDVWQELPVAQPIEAVTCEGNATARDDRIWTRPARVENDDLLVGDCINESCPRVYQIGGMGADLELSRPLEMTLWPQLETLAPTSFEARVAGEATTTLQGTVELVVRQAPVPALDMVRTDFFVDDEFLGTSQPTPCGSEICSSLVWMTDVADGPHTLSAHTYVGQPQLSGWPVFAARDDLDVIVDNPPTIQLVSRGPHQFSPAASISQFPTMLNATIALQADPSTPSGFGWFSSEIVHLNNVVETVHPWQGGTQSQLLSWSGNIAGEPAPSGLYVWRIKAADQDQTREVSLDVPVRLDRDPPRAGCIPLATQLHLGCDPDITLGASDGPVVIGPSGPTLVLEVQPFAVDGLPGQFQGQIAGHIVATRSDASAPWTFQPAGMTTTLRIPNGETMQALSLAYDDSGNLECSPCSGDAVRATDLRHAADARALERMPAILRADLDQPRIQFFADSLLINGERIQGNPTVRVANTTTMDLAFTVVDPTSETLDAQLHFRTQSASHNDVQLGLDAAAPQGDEHAIHWQGWDLLADDPVALPEAVYDVAVEVTDPGRNVAQRALVQLIVDRSAPTVRAASIDYGPDQDHATKGTVVNVIVDAMDPAIGSVLSAPQDLTLVANLTSTGGPEAARLEYKEADGRFHLRTPYIFPDLDLPASGLETFPVVLTVLDAVGNHVELDLDLVAGDPGIRLRPGPIGVTETTLSVDFLTDVNTTLEAHLTGPDGTLSSAFVDPSKQHTTHFADLTPGATYSLQAKATIPGASSESLTVAPITLLHGLDVNILGLPEHALLSGDVRFFIEPTSLDGTTAAQARVDLRSVSATTTIFERSIEGRQDLRFVSDAFQDGVHDVVVNLTADRDVVERSRTVIIDNTPPEGRFLEPGAGATLGATPELLRLEAFDLNGLAQPLDVALAYNGETVSHATLQFQDGAWIFEDPPALPQGPVRIQVMVTDAAGNAGPITVDVEHDGLAPAIQLELLDASVVRPGDLLRLRLTGEEQDTWARAAINLTALGGPAHALLSKHDDGWFTETLVPTDARDGVVELHATVRDHLGRAATDTLAFSVDATPPALVRQSIPDAAGQVQLTFSEPVRILSMDPSMLLTDSGMTRTHALTPPAGTQSMTLVVRDVAGHEAAVTATLLEAASVQAPEQVAAHRVPGDGILVTWTPTPSGIVELTRYGQDGQTIVYEGPASRHLDATVVPGKAYRYEVRNSAGAAVTDIISIAAQQENNLQVRPGLGDEKTQFLFDTTLHGMEQQRPDVWLIVGDRAVLMQHASGADCRVTCQYAASTQLTPLDLRTPNHDWYVEVHQGDRILRVPDTGRMEGPVVLASPDHMGASATPDTQAGVFANGPSLALLAATIMLLAWRRRR
ncbi:MAG: hypothetical protein ACPHID_02415 [Thermoplasmatota archaeon]